MAEIGDYVPYSAGNKHYSLAHRRHSVSPLCKTNNLARLVFPAVWNYVIIIQHRSLTKELKRLLLSCFTKIRCVNYIHKYWCKMFNPYNGCYFILSKCKFIFVLNRTCCQRSVWHLTYFIFHWSFLNNNNEKIIQAIHFFLNTIIGFIKMRQIFISWSTFREGPWKDRCSAPRAISRFIWSDGTLPRL